MKLLLCLVLLLAPLTLQAAEATKGDPVKAPVATPAADNNAAAAKVPADAAKTPPTDSKTATKSDGKTGSEPFVPSVQISEDLSVSFPVDI